MRFLRTPLGGLLAVALAVAALGVGAVAWQVHTATHPARAAREPLDFESMLVRVDDVEFDAVDGVRLSGWRLPGAPGRPTVLLCHDAGQDRGSLIHLALALQARGFGTLLFDFRGHGASADAPTTFGLAEKRDVQGALDWLQQQGVPPRDVGIYGVGMGAYAALLAAEDRPRVGTLVLDAPYPDAGFELSRRVWSGNRTAERWLGFVSGGVFAALHGQFPGRPRSEDVLAGLLGRDVLLLAPDGDAELVRAMQDMVRAIPEQSDADGSLKILPGTQSEGLYGDDLARYYEEVSGFFDHRLAGAERAGL